MTRKTHAPFLILGVWLMMLVTAGRVHANTENLLAPQQVIQDTSRQLQQTLQQPELKTDFSKATEAVESIIEPHIDFDRVASLTLGKYWNKATPAQKERFNQEFKRLLVRTYTTAFLEYADWKIRYLPLQMNPEDQRTVVRTEIMQSGAHATAVNYRMIQGKKGWQVYDILIEGISLLQNYRASFVEEINRTGSLDQLIQQLASRNSSAMKANHNPRQGS